MYSESEKRRHRCCFTGHRPEKLTRSETELKTSLEAETLKALKDGFNVFISGMARGVDIFAAEAVLKLRDTGHKIILVCACPFEGFFNNWESSWQERCRNVLAEADHIWYTSKRYSRSCYQIRNEWMVNHSSRIIAVFDGRPSGTKNTVDYALTQNLSITYIKP